VRSTVFETSRQKRRRRKNGRSRACLSMGRIRGEPEMALASPSRLADKGGGATGWQSTLLVVDESEESRRWL
jgi:hypothetical protein